MRTYRSGASKDAAAERRAEALTAAGVPIRDDADRRGIVPIRVGDEIQWTAHPRRGYANYRIVDDLTGELVMHGTVKDALKLAARKWPRCMSPRHCM